MACQVVISFFAVNHPDEQGINLCTFHVFRWNDMRNKGSDGMVRMVKNRIFYFFLPLLSLSCTYCYVVFLAGEISLTNFFFLVWFFRMEVVAVIVGQR